MFLSPNRHRKISEGSCDTEDWSNDAENSALRHSNKLHFKTYSNRKELFSIAILLAALVSIRDFFQKLTDLKFLNASVSLFSTFM